MFFLFFFFLFFYIFFLFLIINLFVYFKSTFNSFCFCVYFLLFFLFYLSEKNNFILYILDSLLNRCVIYAEGSYFILLNWAFYIYIFSYFAIYLGFFFFEGFPLICISNCLHYDAWKWTKMLTAWINNFIQWLQGFIFIYLSFLFLLPFFKLILILFNPVYKIIILYFIHMYIFNSFARSSDSFFFYILVMFFQKITTRTSLSFFSFDSYD